MFSNNLWHGFGVHHENGRVYEGEFNNGRRHGMIITSEDDYQSIRYYDFGERVQYIP
jgi:hypothetical protein